MTFGKGGKQGALLSDLDTAYVRFLIRKRVYRRRPDLYDALVDHGYMTPEGDVTSLKPTGKAFPRSPRWKAPPEGWVLPPRPASEDEERRLVDTEEILKRYKVSLDG